MNQYLKYTLTVAVTAAALVAYQYEGKPEQAGLAQQAPNQVPIQVTEIKNEIAQVEQTIPQEGATEQASASSVFQRMKERLDVGYDPMLVFASAEFTEEEIAAYNRLHILPFNPVVDEVCFETTSEIDGEILNQCNRVREREEHPYATLELTELGVLAQTDAAAALFMGKRVNSAEEAILWYLRATALSNKTGPLMSLLARQLSVRSYERDARRVSADIAGLYAAATIEQLAKNLGDPRANPEKALSALRENLTDLQILESIPVAVSQLESEISKIRSDVGVASDA